MRLIFAAHPSNAIIDRFAARIRRKRSYLLSVALAGALAVPSSSPVEAQAVGSGVNAGSLQRRIDTLTSPAPASRPADAGAIVLPGVTVESIADVPDDPNAPKLHLSEWRFSGNSLFGTPQLSGVLAGLTGREMSLAEIDRAARMIEAYYAENGYVARVSAPPQQVVDGVVLLEVQEARYAGVAFEGQPPTRVSPEVIERVFDGDVEPGSILRPEALDRPLLLANRLYGVSVRGALAPGRNPGETVLLLNGVDGKPYSVDLSVDNFGSRSVGEHRGNAQFALYSPLGLGDLLLARVTATEGSPNGQLRYEVPVGFGGARVWADIGYMHYDVTRDELKALDPKGESLTLAAGATLPLVVSRRGDLDLNFSVGHDDLKNKVRGGTASDYRINRATIGLSGSRNDDFFGGGVTGFGVSYTRGRASGEDAGAHFSDDFDVGRLDLSRQQYLTERLSFMANLSAQVGPQGLDSAEEFFLGGPFGVRAYPIGEGDGPTGAVVNLGLRYQIDRDWAVTGFYDHGWIADRTTPGEPDDYQLKGLGATVSWVHPDGWAADFTLAHRLGHNPNSIDDPANPSRDGDDQDGSLRDVRVWFQLRKTF